MVPPLYFLGLRFWNGNSNDLLHEIDRTGGMLAVPSAPSLAQAMEDPALMIAYQCATWSVMDGGYVAMIVRLLGRKTVRISGLQLMDRLLAEPDSSPIPLRARRVLWVVPNTEEEKRIRDLLASKSFLSELQYYYTAPFYQTEADFHDQRLMTLVSELQPDWIVLCLGGGRQEKVGYHLAKSTENSARRPVILCTGAAIAFFTGGQAKIPNWADRLYLGWFLRIIEKPAVFFPRYAKAIWHFPFALCRYRGKWFAEAQ